MLILAIMLCGAVSAAELTVGPGETYTNIQSAVTAATGGDTINVKPNGVNPYIESVTVNKNLSIKANGNVTIQKPASASYAIYMTSSGSGSTIQGFKIIKTEATMSDSGIILDHANNCNILNNKITGFSIGIISAGSSNVISENTIDSGANSVGYSYGIELSEAADNVVSRNTIKTTGTGTGSSIGIPIFSASQNNIISGNTIYTTHQGTGSSSGIRLTGSSLNTISGNTMTAISTSDTYGLYVVSNSNNNKISGNNIENFDTGVRIESDCTGNVVNFNRIIANDNAIVSSSSAPLDARYNWYGSNADPGSQMFGNIINYSPWLIMTVTASPGNIYTGSTSTITADFTHDSNEGIHDPALGHFPDGVGVLFTTNLGNVGSKSVTTFTSNGAAVTILRGDEGPGLATLTASLDSQSPLQTIVNILQIPDNPINTTNTTQVNAASSTGRTVGMQETGVPIAPLALAILMMLCGFAGTRRR